ncbi:MAG: hypothetical protein KME07_14040 [Pegethrix bostrychoides GSE-TBD4-15B]|jgi:Ca2+-binding RTX toxin-like protein|uniref:Calcium-binding protein n=1 Tax=Pegethrix bostrychoides GSE-TBD4-15B TaxID=2839662 RepID=A0A951PC73_9CYAN|nr:hypothetical protein [Pegethrix bostrychoides GSE-TBD4-15B]
MTIFSGTIFNDKINARFAGIYRDTIYGQGGDDTITGAELSDTHYGGKGNDTISGEDGDDQLHGEEGDDTVYGRFDQDKLYGGDGNDTLDGGEGNDELYGLAGNDTLIGYDGNDYLYGVDGDDTMSGGRGDDIYVVDSIGDVVTESVNEGFDQVSSSISYTLSANVEGLLFVPGNSNLDGTGNDLDNFLSGNAGNNVLRGLGGNDKIDGGVGDDTLDGGAGDDTMTGGLGNDIYSVDSSGDTITELVDQGFDSVNASVSYTLSLNVENLTLLGTANIDATGNELNNVITGNAGNNILRGLGGDDTLNGGAGDDTLDGGFGFDKLDGGTGIDTTTYDFYAGGINADLQTGVVSFPGSGSILTDTLANIENLIGSRGNDTIAGNDLNNVLTGNAGNDTLDGKGGTDQLIGGLGDDTYIISDASDTIVEAVNAGTDTVNAAISYVLGDNLENLTLTGTDNINGTGNALNNVLTGNSGNNLLNGKEGNDTLIGGLGNDIYIVNDAGDQVIESANGGLDVIAASVNYTLSDNVEHLGLTGTESLNATGNALDNILVGNVGVNMLDGGAGKDILIGGGGRDTLKGGTEADQFVFTAISDRVDSIVDFSKREGDKILLVASGFQGLKSGAVKRKQFVLGKQAKDGNDRLIYNKKTGALFYDADGTGGAAQTKIATLMNKPILGASDLMVAVSPAPSLF